MDFRKKSNKSYTIIAKTIAYLKEQNSLQELATFLDHDTVGVRVWAATHLLPINEAEAIRVLKLIAQGAGIISFGAEIVLRELDKGTLKL